MGRLPVLWCRGSCPIHRLLEMAHSLLFIGVPESAYSLFYVWMWHDIQCPGLPSTSHIVTEATAVGAGVYPFPAFILQEPLSTDPSWSLPPWLSHRGHRVEGTAGSCASPKLDTRCLDLVFPESLAAPGLCPVLQDMLGPNLPRQVSLKVRLYVYLHLVKQKT